MFVKEHKDLPDFSQDLYAMGFHGKPVPAGVTCSWPSTFVHTVHQAESEVIF